MKSLSFAALAVAMCISFHATAASVPVGIIAAENFYGDVARQISGSQLQVISILSNPDQDPHLIEASPSVGKAQGNAKIVVYSGADCHPWMDKLLSASKASSRQTLVVAQMLQKKIGANPHLRYDAHAMPTYGKQLASSLETNDASHAADYAKNLQTLLATPKPIDQRIEAIKRKYTGTPVTVTEPLFGYIARALGFEMRNDRFQLAVMNDTEPTASDAADFENNLRNHRVRLLIYDSQSSGGAANRMRDLAVQVGVTETAPAGKFYEAWLPDELNAVDKARAKGSK